MEAAVVQNGDRIWVKNGQIHFANRMYDKIGRAHV